MKIEKTERGFGLLKFKDRYGQPCSLQDSSLATEGAIWFGVETRTDLNTGVPLEDADNFRMHLTVKDVEELLPYLQYFVKNGILPDDVEMME